MVDFLMCLLVFGVMLVSFYFAGLWVIVDVWWVVLLISCDFLTLVVGFGLICLCFGLMYLRLAAFGYCLLIIGITSG